MKTVMTANVTYTNHQGVRTNKIVNVKKTFGYGDIEQPTHYSAYALESLGCGKHDLDPIGAIHRLVGDHGDVISIQVS
jgi:hypothetical protein